MEDESQSAGRTRIVAEFVHARRTGKAIAAFPGPVPTTLDEAYDVQAALIAAWPDSLAGWKVAKINDPWREPLGAERYIGPIFARTISQTGEQDRVPAYRDGQAALEAELVLSLGADAAPDRTDWTVIEASAIVGSLRIAIEVAGSPLRILNALGPLAAIAGFGNNNGLLLGPVVAQSPAPLAGCCEVLIDHQLVGRAALWAAPDGPMSAFVFALNQAAALGIPLRKGQVVSTGALTGVHPVHIGQRCAVRFGDLGQIACTVDEQAAT
jgi:2-keto-4-pentenoate hydratase